MTNFEKIKNMSVEELAHTMNIVISNCYKCPICEFCKKNNCRNCRTCQSTWEKWLESEVKNDDKRNLKNISKDISK